MRNHKVLVLCALLFSAGVSRELLEAGEEGKLDNRLGVMHRFAFKRSIL